MSDCYKNSGEDNSVKAACVSLLSWPKDKDLICDEIRESVATFKVVTKIKDDDVLIERWLKHYCSIVNCSDIIIFDNNSSNPRLFDIYNKYRDKVRIYNWSVNHNLIHDVGYAYELYNSLCSSALYYTFIDVDEFLYWTNGKYLIADASLAERMIEFGKFDGFATLWMPNSLGAPSVYNIRNGEGLFGSLLRGGKPVIRASSAVRGFVNHNVQLLEENPGLTLLGGFVLLHDIYHDPKNRIRVNTLKCISHGFVSDSIELEIFIQKGSFGDLHPAFCTYIEEIVACRAVPSRREWEPVAGQITVMDSGEMFYVSSSDQFEIERFVDGVFTIESIKNAT